MKIFSFSICVISDFRRTFIKTLARRIHNSPNRGLFVHSCYLHDHVLKSDEWTCLTVANRVRFSFNLISQFWSICGYLGKQIIFFIVPYLFWGELNLFGICNFQTMRQAVADWYFDRSSFREIDTKSDSPKNCTNSFCE